LQRFFRKRGRQRLQGHYWRLLADAAHLPCMVAAHTRLPVWVCQYRVSLNAWISLLSILLRCQKRCRWYTLQLVTQGAFNAGLFTGLPNLALSNPLLADKNCQHLENQPNKRLFWENPDPEEV